jgi:HAD superfamily hydrolase (TIGR01490 family)
MKKHLAIFDFCETLIGFQTLDAFIEFVQENYPTNRSKKIRRIFLPLKNLRIMPNFIYRRVQIARLKGIQDAILDRLAHRFVNEKILPAENKSVAEKITFHQKQGDTVAIASGGLAIYIKMYAHKKAVSCVAATQLAFDKNGICLGKILGRDCMGHAKIPVLVATLGESGLSLSNFDLSGSSVYSDSMSDLPLFELVGNRFLVHDNATIEKLNV